MSRPRLVVAVGNGALVDIPAQKLAGQGNYPIDIGILHSVLACGHHRQRQDDGRLVHGAITKASPVGTGKTVSIGAYRTSSERDFGCEAAQPRHH